MRTNRKLQLLYCHGLQCDLEIKGADGDCGALLVRPNPCFLDDLDIFDTTASDDGVGIRVGYLVAVSGQLLTSELNNGCTTYPTMAVCCLLGVERLLKPCTRNLKEERLRRKTKKTCRILCLSRGTELA